MELLIDVMSCAAASLVIKLVKKMLSLNCNGMYVDDSSYDNTVNPLKW